MTINHFSVVDPRPGSAPGVYSDRKASMVGLIVSIVVIGLIAGALVRLVVPGRQDLSIPMTIVVGIGSFVGGFLGYLIFHQNAQDGFFNNSGVIGAFIGAVIGLLIWTTVANRGSVRG